MSSTDVWVHDYTTAAGVDVAGHWRRRHGAPPGSTQEHSAPAPGLRDSPPDPSLPMPPPHGAGSPPARPDRVAAAEARHRAAVVEAGVSALRLRTGQPTDHAAALRARAAARSDLDAARQDAAAPAARQQSPAAAAQPAAVDRCPACGQYRDDQHQCPTPPGLPDGNYAAAKGDDRVKAMVADLESSVKAIVESGQLRRWLDAMASDGLSRWSANNRILAAVQMLQRGESLDGLHLMGFRQWEKFNRKVSRGAKAVWILAPVTRKIVEEAEDGSSTERHRVVAFKAVPVFNVSDTTGDPLPAAPVRPAPGAATPGTLEGLRDRVGQAGYSYQETEIPGCRPATAEGTLGYTDPRTKRIVVDARLSQAQKASTIAHELGHVHCGHVDVDYSQYERHRGRMETEAEMTAYLVNRSRGMTRDQVDAFTPGYIAGWSRGDPKAMHNAMDKATRAYNTIMNGPWPTPKGA